MSKGALQYRQDTLLAVLQSNGQQNARAVQMAFLMSGASFLSPSSEAAKETSTIDRARDMLRKCREASTKLQSSLNGKLPADAAKMQLYLDLQVRSQEQPAVTL